MFVFSGLFFIIFNSKKIKTLTMQQQMFCKPKHAQINQQKYTDSTLKIAAMIRVRYNALDLKFTQMLAKC